MNIIEYINTPLSIAYNEDEALNMLNTMCSGYYITNTPTNDSITLKKRFNIDTVLCEDKLYFKITEEIVNLFNNDTLDYEVEKIGLDKNKFII